MGGHHNAANAKCEREKTKCIHDQGKKKDTGNHSQASATLVEKIKDKSKKVPDSCGRSASYVPSSSSCGVASGKKKVPSSSSCGVASGKKKVMLRVEVVELAVSRSFAGWLVTEYSLSASRTDVAPCRRIPAFSWSFLNLD